jgi:hypothetical protein
VRSRPGGALASPTDEFGQSIDTTANNTDPAPSLHRDCGLTYVTDAVSPIGAGEEIGPRAWVLLREAEAPR